MAKKKEIKNIDELMQEALIPQEEQPYELPENWVWVRLGETSNFINGDRGKNYPSKQHYKNEGIAFINAGHIVNNHLDFENMNYISRETFDLLGSGKIQKNDIIYCLRGSLGKTAIVKSEIKGAIASSLVIIRPRINTIPEFINKYLISEIGEQMIEKYENGTAQPNLSANNAKQYAFPMPPLAEQKRIVEKLENMLSKIKEVKELIAEAKETFELRRAGILHKAFTGELTKQWRIDNAELIIGGAEKLLEQINEEKIKKWEEECRTAETEGKKKPKKPEIKEIEEMKVAEEEQPYELSEGWAWVRLGDLADIKGGKRLPKGKSLVKENTGYPYIRAGDLKNGTVILDDIQYLEKNIYEKIKNYSVEENDLYITIVGACIGDTGTIPKEMSGANLTENAAKITNIFLMNKFFISYWLRTPIQQKEIENKILSATLGKLSLDRIKSFSIPVISLGEQKEIVRQLELLLKAEEDAKDLLEMEEQIDLLEKAVLSRAFRGELGTNNPDDEPAIELLKRVLEEKK